MLLAQLQCCAKGMPTAERLLVAKGLSHEADLNLSYFLCFLLYLISSENQSPNLAAQNWEEFTKTNPLFPKGPHHNLLVAHFGTPRVLLTHSELCPSAQEELGGLGDGAVVGAAV